MGYRDNEYGKLRKVLLCKPTYFEWEPINELAKRNLEQNKFDRQVALEEHEELADALRSAGAEVYYMDPSKPHHYMVYARDFAKNLDDGIYLGRFRMPVRMGEEDQYKKYLKKQGFPVIGQVNCGSLEGGDICFIDPRTIAVGVGARSSLQGVDSMREFLKPQGINVFPVDFEYRFLHLDALFVIVAEKTALICKEALEDEFIKMLEERKYELIDVSANDAMELRCNVLSLGDSKVLSYKQNVDVNKKLRALGFEVMEPSLKMFVSGGGAPRCLTFPLERDTV